MPLVGTSSFLGGFDWWRHGCELAEMVRGKGRSLGEMVW